MSEVKPPTVWIVDMDNRQPRMVNPAKDYQTYGYDQFMADSEKKTFAYDKNGLVFTIHPFYGNSSFCIYINESGVGRVLSNNEEALKGYVNATNKKAANQKATNQNAARQNAARQEASLSPAGVVWIADMNGSGPVREADPNQAESYHKFMSQSGPKKYNVTYNYSGSTIVISPFNGRTGNYHRFCNILVNDKAVYILSDNFEDLEKYNNLTIYQMREGGNRTKRSRKTKRSKRAHTSKRK